MNAAVDITALRRREPLAQEYFLRQYASYIFLNIKRIVGNTQDAEELTQDTLLKALEHIDSYDADKASLKTWLTRIAYNTAFNHLRQHAHQSVYIEETDEELDKIPDEEVNNTLQQYDKGTARQLQDALKQLSAKERAFITLFYYDEWPLRDIAYITGQTIGAIANRLYRIRRKLHYIINNRHDS